MKITTAMAQDAQMTDSLVVIKVLLGGRVWWLASLTETADCGTYQASNKAKCAGVSLTDSRRASLLHSCTEERHLKPNLQNTPGRCVDRRG